jgi:hypothetical protein
MLRPAAAILAVAVVAFPVAALPAPPVTWLAGVALVVLAAGVVTLAVPVVTAGASLALIADALALAIARPPVDPVAAIAFGTALVLLPTLVHLAGRARGATLGPGVVAAQIRQWLRLAACGVAAAAVLTFAAVALTRAWGSLTLPMVVVVATVGAVLAMLGIIGLLMGEPEVPAER